MLKCHQQSQHLYMLNCYSHLKQLVIIMQVSHENYLKAIYIISRKNRGGWVSNSEIASFLDIKPPSVTDMLHKLKKKGLINWQPRKMLRLTKKGLLQAKYIYKNYLSLKNFFHYVLKMNNDSDVGDICCKIEHHIPMSVIQALNTFTKKATTT